MRFELERDGRRVSAFAIRADGVVRGYVNVCAHQGLELDWTSAEVFRRRGPPPDLYGARRDSTIPQMAAAPAGPAEARGSSDCASWSATAAFC